MKNQIHINCDVGEGIGNEAQLMPFLSACNIACGAHAGSLDDIKKCVQLALENKVEIGAHPGFPDPTNFGRLPMQMSDAALITSITEQIQLVQQETIEAGGNLNHIKPHGALYHLVATQEHYAELLIASIKDIDDSLIVYVPYGSKTIDLIKVKLPYIIEGFADRSYDKNLNLVSRKAKNALLTKQNLVLKQVEDIFKNQLTAITGQVLPFYADTICIHGDTPNAVSLLKYIHEQLQGKDNGII